MKSSFQREDVKHWTAEVETSAVAGARPSAQISPIYAKGGDNAK